MVPSREEMERGLAAFAQQVPVHVRYGCAWEATRREDDGRIVLVTSDGEYRARAVVFALGVTTPWFSPIPGIETVPHYVDTRQPADYRGRSVFVIGKRNSGFEIADGLLPWARQVILGSPRPVQTAVIAQASVRVRYLQPYEDATLGGGTLRARPRRRADRAARARLAHRRQRHDPARPDRPGGGRGDRGHRLLDAAPRPRRARRAHGRAGPHPRADAVLGERARLRDLLRGERDAGRAGAAQARRRRARRRPCTASATTPG